MNRSARRLLKSARKRSNGRLSAGSLNTVDAMMGQALARQREGKLDEALRAYREVLEVYPDHVDALRNGGLISIQGGNGAQGLELLRAAARAAPDDAQVQSNLGYALESEGALDEAETVLRRALEIAPDLVAAHANLGNVLKKAGKFEEALDAYRHVLSLSPGDPAAHSNAGNALMYLGRTDAAMEHLLKAVEIDPNLVEALNNLAILHNELGNLGDAIETFRKAAAIEPRLANSHYNLGCALTEWGDSEGAIVSFRDCLDANPNHANACLNLGKLLLDEGRLREAVPTLRKAAAQFPSNPAVLGILANLQADGDDLDEALSVALDAFRADPNSAYALCSLAKTLIERGCYADAAAVYNILAPATNEHDVTAHGWLCDSLLRHGQSRAALGVIDDLLQNAPLTPKQRHGLLIDKAVDAWLGSDATGCRAAVDDAAAVSQGAGALAVEKHALVFERFVVALLEYRERHPELYAGDAHDDLHVIGESHCLAPHGTVVEVDGVSFRMVGHMILGCKAWHLADPQANYLQRAFEAITRGLPDNANILLAIGEIDCRPNEGIYHLHKKKRIDPGKLIGDTVSGFVDFVVEAAARKNLHANFCGVPAPRRDRFSRLSLPGDEIPDYLDVVARFNRTLEQTSTERGCGFLDLYGLSVGDDGTANGRFHIDDTHLLPSALRDCIATD